MALSAAQVKGRIKSLAERNGMDPRVLMRMFMMERFLERVSESEYQENFIIKGGILASSMVGVSMRSTLDIDTSIRNRDLSLENTLLEAGEKFGKLEEKMTADTMKKLIEKQDVLSRPFTDSLKRISELYNQPVTMLMDKDNIYIGIGEQESSASISMKTDYY